MYEVEINRKASKELRKLNDPLLSRIWKAISRLRDDPFPARCKKISGSENYWRIRVGDFRIIYCVEETLRIITIVRVASRGNVYDDL